MARFARILDRLERVLALAEEWLASGHAEPYDAASRALTFLVQADGHGQSRTAALLLTDTEWEEL